MNTQQNPSFSTLPQTLRGCRIPFVQFGGCFYMEIWKPIKGYEGIYQVSNLSRIRSIDRAVKYSNGYNRVQKGITLKQHTTRKGYLAVYLCDHQQNFHTFVHRLVALHFIPNPDSKTQVNHINGIKDDNRVENLEWCTSSENMRHAFDTGLIKAKISNKEVRKARELHSDGLAGTKLSKMYNISQSYMSRILKGEVYPNA